MRGLCGGSLCVSGCSKNELHLGQLIPWSYTGCCRNAPSARVPHPHLRGARSHAPLGGGAQLGVLRLEQTHPPPKPSHWRTYVANQQTNQSTNLLTCHYYQVTKGDVEEAVRLWYTAMQGSAASSDGGIDMDTMFTGATTEARQAQGRLPDEIRALLQGERQLGTGIR